MSKDKSPAPPGSFVELDLDLIDEGGLRTQFETKLKQAHRDLLQYEKESGDMTGTAKIKLVVKMSRAKGASTFFDLEYSTNTDVPCVARGTTVKEANGKLLCQPSGSNEHDPEQQLFYDGKGRIIGGVDPETGEVHEQSVAGRIARQHA